jgi:putative oxidoreductase
VIGRVLTGRGLNLVLRLFLGGLFVYAAFSKVTDPAGFAMSVRGYKIVPFALSNLFALSVSWTEMLAGVMLIIGLWTRKAAGAIAILLGMFIAAITMVLVRGMVVDCGCFGEGGSSTSWLLIVRNLALLTAAVLVIRYNDGFASLHAGRRDDGEREFSATS